MVDKSNLFKMKEKSSIVQNINMVRKGTRTNSLLPFSLKSTFKRYPLESHTLFSKILSLLLCSPALVISLSTAHCLKKVFLISSSSRTIVSLARQSREAFLVSSLVIFPQCFSSVLQNHYIYCSTFCH